MTTEVVQNGHFGGSYELPNLDRARSFVRLLQKDDTVSLLLKSCNEVGEAFLFGGMVRDLIFGYSGKFGDLDIFVSGPLDIDFALSLARTSRRTNFGGIRLVIGKFDVDIWELPKSNAFRMQKGRAVSIPALLDTVCFSTDAVAISLLEPKRVFSTEKFRSTVRSRKFTFVSAPIEVELLQAVRVARLIIKNEVLPDRAVASYFLRAVDLYGWDKLVNAEAKWKGRRVLDSLLIQRVHELCVAIVDDGEIPTAVPNEQLFDIHGRRWLST